MSVVKLSELGVTLLGFQRGRVFNPKAKVPWTALYMDTRVSNMGWGISSTGSALCGLEYQKLFCLKLFSSLAQFKKYFRVDFCFQLRHTEFGRFYSYPFQENVGQTENQ